jgi:multicomponent Na+:H+ antiporter subunit E
MHSNRGGSSPRGVLDFGQGSVLMSVLANAPAFSVRAALARGAGLLAVWVVLIGTSPSDLATGVLAAAAATRISLVLLPPGPRRVRLTVVLSLIPHFLWKSVVAGVDVARRALDPRLPLRLGFVAYPERFRSGPARNAFASYTSLLPGTLSVEDDGETLLCHCLDIGQPVAAELASEEAALAQALGGHNADQTERGPRR